MSRGRRAARGKKTEETGIGLEYSVLPYIWRTFQSLDRGLRNLRSFRSHPPRGLQDPG